MNLLFKGFGEDGGGTSVKIGDKYFKINYQYYYVLKIMDIVYDKDLSETKRASLILKYFYKDEIPQDLKAALEACFKFIAKGNYQTTYTGSGSDNSPTYDFALDHQLIFASMTQSYGEAWYEWHWWKWKAAFDNLPSDSPIKEVISIRSRKITSKMSPEERKNLQQLKQIYKLNDDHTPQMTAKELEAMVLAG